MQSVAGGGRVGAVSSTTTTNAVFEPRLPHPFGQYELLEEIARGGMGVVYKARQSGLNRLCAVKMLRSGARTGGVAAGQELEAEAAAAASLTHPNIIRIYEVGCHEGQSFFSMEYVLGDNLAHWTATRVLAPRQTAGLVRAIASAVAYAHAQGVWHLDLKPGNVLMDADGVPRLTDFGLARRRDLRAANVGTAGIGSPNYLAPEQASTRYGEPRAVTDVFGLGALLYFLLTDRPPFREETLEETLKAVLERDPPRPGSLRTGVPEDLETICLRCLEKRPSRRYASVAEVVEELDCFLRDEPIRRRGTSPALRFGRWCRRHPVWPVLVLVVGVGGTVTFRSVQARMQALHAAGERARAAQVRAENAEWEARRFLYSGDMALAFAAQSAGDPGRVRSILDRQVPGGGQRDPRGWEWNFLDGLVHSDAVGLLGRMEGEVQRVLSLPGGGRLLAADNAGVVVEWELPSGRELRRKALRGVGLAGVVASPDGTWLALNDRLPGATNTLVHILDAMDWSRIRTWAVPGLVGPRAVSSDGSTLWLTGRDSWVALSVPTGSVREHPLAVQSQPAALAVSPDGLGLVMSYGPRALAWCPAEGPADISIRRFEVAQPDGKPDVEVLSLTYSPDGRWWLSGGSDGRVLLWDAESREVVSSWEGHSSGILSVRFSPDGTRVLTVGRDAFGLVREFPSGRELARVRGLKGFTSDAAWLGDEIVTAGGDRSVRRWKPRPAEGITSLTNVPPGTLGAMLLPDGTHAVVTGETGMQLWQLPGGEVIQQLPTDPDALASAFVHRPDAPSGLAARYWVGGRIGVRSLELEGRTTSVEESDWTPVPRFSGAADLAFDAAGSRLAVVDTANGVRVYGVDPLELKHRFEFPLARTAVFSPDGRRLAALADGRIAVWDLSASTPVASIRNVPQVQALAFSPSGDRLLVTSRDGIVRVLDSAMIGSPEKATLSPLSMELLCVAMSRDGSRVAAGTIDGGVVLWDVATGRELGVLKLGSTPVYSLRFAEDQSLVVAGGNGVKILGRPAR